MADPIVLRAARWVDIVAGVVRSPAVVLVEGERITAVNPRELPPSAVEIDLGDVTLVPGLMDMETNLIIGGPSSGKARADVGDSASLKMLRAVVNCRTVLDAGFTTVRNLGLFQKTNGLMLDVDLAKGIDLGWIPGPRVIAAGHAITATGGHLEPTMFQGLAPWIMPLSVEEGLANGVPEVRKAVRYQIKYGARLIKVSASGGVMSHAGGPPGAQTYSQEEFDAIAEEAHRFGVKVAAHAQGDDAIRACVKAGIDCIEHGFLASDDTLKMMADAGTFLVTTTALVDRMDVSREAPEKQARAAAIFPQAKSVIARAHRFGVKIACGTDAPAIPHGDQPYELCAIVDRGLSPMEALKTATLTSAELVGMEDSIGRIEAGYYADIIAVPGDPSQDIKVVHDIRFVMKGGSVWKNRQAA
jgi:imidazolonepropionase-like amidohydrolase